MRSILLPIAVAAGFGSSAQVILTDANTSPQVGDVYARSLGNYLDPVPSGGSPLVYDYSTVDNLQVDTLTYTSPTDTEWYSGLVSGADAEVECTYGGPDGYARYYAGTSAGLELLGFTDGGTYALSDTKLAIPYPCSTGTSWSDAYAGNDAWGYGRSGTVSVVAGPVCDVITPLGTFNDVLRLDITEDMDYTTLGIVTLHRDINIASYHAPGIHHPVMYAITSTGVDSLGDPIPSLYGEMCLWLHPDLGTGTPAVATGPRKWSLAGNLVEDVLRVSGHILPGAGNYRIWSAAGVLVREGRSSELLAGVDVDDLSVGIFVLHCDGAALRFVKQ